MSTETKLQELIRAYHEARTRGEFISLEFLCRHCPELLPECRRRLGGSGGAKPPRGPEIEGSGGALICEGTHPEGDPAATHPYPSPVQLELCVDAEPVPGYRLVRLRGRGGFGEVWEAMAPGDFRVAFKFVALRGTAGELEQRALEIIKNLRHPNLLTIFGTWQTQQWLIIGMELADRTLLDELDQSISRSQVGISPRTLLRYAQEVARVIDYLNKPRHYLEGKKPVGVQHGDIKPQNILLIGQGVKVGDFGLVHLLREQMQKYGGGLTPQYAAPELFEGRISRWSDQYALAVTWCHLRTGQLPFPKGARPGTPPDLSLLPEQERAVVARALTREPKERYPTCRAFVKALAECKREPTPRKVRSSPAAPTPRAPLPLTVPTSPWPPAAPPATVRPEETPRPVSRGPTRAWKSAPPAPRRSWQQTPAGTPRKSWLWRVVVLAGLSFVVGVLWVTIFGTLSAPPGSLVHQTEEDASVKTKGAKSKPPSPKDFPSPSPPTRGMPKAKKDGPVRMQPEKVRELAETWRKLPEKERAQFLAERTRGMPVEQRKVIEEYIQEMRLHVTAKPARDKDGPVKDGQVKDQSEKDRRVSSTKKDGKKDPTEITSYGGGAHPWIPPWVIWVGGGAFLGLLALLAWQMVRRWKGIGETQILVEDEPDVIYATDTRRPPGSSLRSLPGLEETPSRIDSVLTLEGHVDAVWCVTFTPAGDFALSGSMDATLRLWDLNTRRESHRFEGHADGVTGLVCTPDGKQVLSAGLDDVLRLWDLATGQELRRLTGHRGRVLAVALLPDGQHAVSAGEDRIVRVWELSTGQIIRQLEGPSGWVNSLAVSSDGQYLASGDESGRVLLWDWPAGGEGRILAQNQRPVLCVRFAPGGNALLTTGHDPAARLWSVAGDKPPLLLRGHTDWVRSGCFSPDGQWIVTGSDDESLCWWNRTTGELVARMVGHLGSVLSVAFAPDGTRVLSGSDDQSLRVWQRPNNG